MEEALPPVTTWLVRHGQSASNAGQPAMGHGNVPLTALGREQADALALRVDRQPDLLIVSPFLRARETSEPIRTRWPAMRCETWPIQELTYLSPTRCHGMTAATRRPMVDAYWRRRDPAYVDGSDAESFSSFSDRLRDFHRRLLELDCAYVVAVGHGQFFSAYMMGLTDGFAATPEWMTRYRAVETGNPIANCEIIELSGEALSRRGRATLAASSDQDEIGDDQKRDEGKNSDLAP
jgi:broad specificity phosphatase PhoE